MTETSLPDFPIPDPLEGFWIWDKVHAPRPNTPLTQEFIHRSLSAGFTGAMDEFACPVGIAFRPINYYLYMGTVRQPLRSESFEQRLARYHEILSRVVPEIGRLWAEEWLPAILPGIEKAKGIDYASLSDAELLATLDDLYGDLVDRYVVHGRINFITIAVNQFVDFYNENLEPAEASEPYEALQGFPTRSLEAGQGLWRLSRMVKKRPSLMKIFQESEPRALTKVLAQSAEGRDFLAQLAIYLDEFGWRSDAFELSDPTWREDPSIPLNAIQGYIYLNYAGDPGIRFGETVRRREELLSRARLRLARNMEKLERFEHLYKAACHNLAITEDHNFYIDQVGNAVLRLPILELGRRLSSRGLIDATNDVFMLFLEEIKAGLGGQDQRSLVARRRAEMEGFARMVPPLAIGRPPPPSGDPMEAAVQKMFGLPPEPSRDPAVINGIPASPGTARGRAKVVRRLAEAGKLGPGDILVCDMTMPPWTPLFSTVSAVVADTGGILSHCAIVAREYRLPCVVHTVVGTTLIKDGMVLTVDGTKGVVRIEER